MKNGEKISRLCYVLLLPAVQEKNLSAHLRQREKSAEHITNMDTCCIPSQELQTNTSGCSCSKPPKRDSPKRWIAIVNNLSVILHLVATQTGCLSLFLGKVEMMAQFDPVMREHLRVIWAKDPSNTCLSKHFQNDLTWFNINNLPCVHTYIVERVEKAKYYAVKPVFNVTKGASLCTSVLLRIVNCESSNVPVHEHFVVVFFTWHNRKRLMWVF